MQHPGLEAGEVGEPIELLYREHGDRLWSSVYAFAGDADVANDAVAEAFAQVLRRGDAVRTPLAWVWRAAFRLAAGDLQRRRMLSPEVPERSYDMPDVGGSVLAAVRRLPERQRAAIVLHYYADQSIREAARIMGTTPTAVGVHLFRGRKRLRELLGDDID
ncbi:MAG: RNA polymerase sigma factor [Actinomycetota bacterium]